MVDATFPTISIRVETPDGTMFVHVLEDKTSGEPVMININIGKAGTNLAAWADATARLASLHLPNIHKIIEELTGITSNRFRRLQRGEVISSGPEGLAFALLKYAGQRYIRSKPKRRSGEASIGD